LWTPGDPETAEEVTEERLSSWQAIIAERGEAGEMYWVDACSALITALRSAREEGVGGYWHQRFDRARDRVEELEKISIEASDRAESWRSTTRSVGYNTADEVVGALMSCREIQRDLRTRFDEARARIKELEATIKELDQDLIATCRERDYNAKISDGLRADLERKCAEIDEAQADAKQLRAAVLSGDPDEALVPLSRSVWHGREATIMIVELREALENIDHQLTDPETCELLPPAEVASCDNIEDVIDCIGKLVRGALDAEGK
jgi:uncharacterized protein (UPF0297 family)